MAAEQLRSLLSGLSYLDGLSRPALARIARHTRSVTVERGGVVVRTGDPAPGVYFVVTGRMTAVVHLPEHGRKVVRIIGPGDSFGEPFMFLGDPYPFDWQAVERSRLLFVEKAALVREVDRDPELARRIIVSLSRRLASDIRTARASAMSGSQRIADLLLDAAGYVRPGATPVVTLPANKLSIASRLDLTPEHLSRILRKLSEQGLIRVDGLQVTILDPAGLRAIIDPVHQREGRTAPAQAFGAQPS